MTNSIFFKTVLQDDEFNAWGLFFEGPKKFLHLKSGSKVSNLMITELFYLHILKINTSTIPYKKFQVYAPLCF